MQVSQQSDSVTHAVIGAAQSVEMGISDSAALMHIFSTTLYTWPMLATAREIICNGWDGHIVSGNTGLPLEITLTDTALVIRDFGPGIPHEKIGPIYGVFGNSTKREDGSVTGGFGLGSKAPFSYSDNFEVVSHHGGVKSVYRVSKSSMEKGGKPSIDTMVQVPTDETGIRVTIPVKSPRDAEKFMGHVVEVLVLGGIQANVNGKLIETLPTHETPTGYIISSFRGTNGTSINLRYGNVVYPIPRMEQFEDIWDSISNNMDRLWNGANITFLAEPDTISIAPSREAMVFTDGTIASIQKLLAKFNPEDAKVSSKVTRQLTDTQINTEIRAVAKTMHPKALDETINVPQVRGTCAEHASGAYAFQMRKAAIAHAISSRKTYIQSSSNNLLMKRVRAYLLSSPLVDKSLKKPFLSACIKYEAVRKYKLQYHNKFNPETLLQATLMRYFTSPLLAAVRANPNMEMGRLSYVDQPHKRTHNLHFVNPVLKVLGGIQEMCGFSYKRVLLARSRTAIKQFFDKQRYNGGEQMLEGWVVYQIPTSEKHWDSIQATFEEQGFEVHRYMPARTTFERTPGEPTEPKEKKVTPKRKGYLTLWSALSGNEFKLLTARANCKPENHVFDPKAYVVLGQELDDVENWEDISNAAQLHIRKHWGKEVAVITSTQVAKFEAKGIPEVSKYIYQLVEEKLSEGADFRRYLAFGRHVKCGDYPEGRDGVLRYMGQHPELVDSLDFKFRFGVSAETEAYIMLWEDRSVMGARRSMPKLAELAEKIPKHKMVEVLRDRMRTSGWEYYVDMTAIGSALKNRLAGDQSLTVPYTIVREMLKEGAPQ